MTGPKRDGTDSGRTMAKREYSVEIAAPPEAVFDLIHDYERRLTWDPFLKKACLLDGAERAGRGVKALCVAKSRLGGVGMETVYVSCNRPTVAAVKMTQGPWFLAGFGASLRQDAIAEGRTKVTYAFTLRARPSWARPLLEPLLAWVFARETRQRLKALKQFLEAGRSN